MRLLLLWTALLLAAAALGGCGGKGVESKAGASAVVISPRSEDLGQGVYLGGYGGYQSRRASGVHDDIYSRALALSDGSETVVLVALDLVGISNVQLAKIRAEAAAQAGIPEGQILISSTHSHATPDFQGLWGGAPESYRDYLRGQVVQSIAEAVSNLEDAEVWAASATAEGFTENRRGWGFTDDVLTVIQARRPDGSAIATLVNFAVHPTVTGPENVEVSRDFAGHLVDVLEAQGGGLVIFVNGDQGDSIPADSGDFDVAREYGERLAAAVTAALDTAEEVEGALHLTSSSIEIPVEHPLFEQAVGLGILDYEVPRRDGKPYAPTRVSLLRIGDQLQAAALPGEALTRLGQTIRERLSARYELLLGLTDDTLGYLVPADEWQSGRNENYEETVSISSSAAAIVLDGVTALLEEEQ